MLRSSILSLAGALACGLVPVAAKAQGQAPDLPDGAGKEVVAAVCTTCHETNQITRSSGYTEDGWRELIGTMVDLAGSPEERDRVTQYLATHFPPNERRAPKLMPGEAEIAFKEWTVPTLGQRSRDPVEAADGAIWWAGQWGNLIGRIDPTTGAMTEYPLPAGAMPHTVTLDDAGNVWYTGNKNATIGMLDPDTGKITEYRMPDPAAKDPHTAVFDADGILWFTLQQSNMVGRLDPASGEIRLVTMPTPDAKPYGIKIDPRAPHGLPATAATAWCGSTRRPWRSPRSICRSRRPPCAGSTSPRTARSGTSTPRKGGSAASTRRAARSPSGHRRAGPNSASLRDRGRGRHRLVQRVGQAAGRPGPLRPEDRDLPELADPLGRRLRRHHPPHAPDPGGDLLIHQSSTNRIILVDLARAATQ